MRGESCGKADIILKNQKQEVGKCTKEKAKDTSRSWRYF